MSNTTTRKALNSEYSRLMKEYKAAEKEQNRLATSKQYSACDEAAELMEKMQSRMCDICAQLETLEESFSSASKLNIVFP